MYCDCEDVLVCTHNQLDAGNVVKMQQKMQQSMLAYAQQLVAEANGHASTEEAQSAESPQRDMQKPTYIPRIQRDLLEKCAAERCQRESRRRLQGGMFLFSVPATGTAVLLHRHDSKNFRRASC